MPFELDRRETGRPPIAQQPLVTVGIPVYNGEKYLARALESALAQAYEPLEVIISDNASTDGTEAIARHFAQTDHRVSYVRNSRNLGAWTNFARVLAMARGKYFTWLAHDDLLSDRAYIRIVVDFLERNPDVVGCTCYIHLLDYEGQGSRIPMEFAELHPDRPWREARLEFFHWPLMQDFALYGMFRRAALARISIAERAFDRRNASFVEAHLLTALCTGGRIVAIPEFLRDYRESYPSEARRILQAASPFDLCVLGLGVKLIMLRNAWRMRLPFTEKVELLKVTLGNIWRANLQRPIDYRRLIDERQRELKLLRQVAQERLQLINSLNAEIEKRRRILDTLQPTGTQAT